MERHALDYTGRVAPGMQAHFDGKLKFATGLLPPDGRDRIADLRAIPNEYGVFEPLGPSYNPFHGL